MEAFANDRFKTARVMLVNQPGDGPRDTIALMLMPVVDAPKHLTVSKFGRCWARFWLAALV
ncbi:hypothetical protein [Bradyrhizobium sp. CIR3A]|uniref:hypothetical protein n=1 Tax=Bradyrhizobium sp. CIR3A TaxID=2663838 RepID=UPI001606D1B9|nr:hypothetical protein [Bradyrhizobium sp. CIR3A]MBB4264117.1 hypothetical protein [Bradyrhizobium sp. CIR3A]